MYTIYQVKQGDTLASVANKFNIPVEMLSSLNGIMVGTILNPGDNIVVPKTEDNSYFSEYSVQKGDNIYSIARMYNTNPKHLLRLNGLNETDIIYPNQIINVPKQGVTFYVTEDNDTLNNLVDFFKVSANEINNQNKTIYLTNDQLIVYRK